MKKTVITYGTFDMFHVGHLLLLRRLASLGERLIVAVSTDDFNARKGKRTLIPFEQRAEIVSSARYVDHVIPETCWEQKISDIQQYQVDIFAIGDDWTGHFDFLAQYCEVIYLPRTPGISTTELKHSLSRFCSVSREDFMSALDVLKTLSEDFN